MSGIGGISGTGGIYNVPPVSSANHLGDSGGTISTVGDVLNRLFNTYTGGQFYHPAFTYDVLNGLHTLLQNCTGLDTLINDVNSNSSDPNYDSNIQKAISTIYTNNQSLTSLYVPGHNASYVFYGLLQQTGGMASAQALISIMASGVPSEYQDVATTPKTFPDGSQGCFFSKLLDSNTLSNSYPNAYMTSDVSNIISAMVDDWVSGAQTLGGVIMNQLTALSTLVENHSIDGFNIATSQVNAFCDFYNCAINFATTSDKLPPLSGDFGTSFQQLQSDLASSSLDSDLLETDTNNLVKAFLSSQNSL